MAVVVAAGGGALLLFPNALGVAALVLCMSAGPLAMVFMMRAMSKHGSSSSSEDGTGEVESQTMDELAALRAEAQHLRASEARSTRWRRTRATCSRAAWCIRRLHRRRHPLAPTL